MINCPKCNNEFEPKGKWGLKKFCSRKCANSRTWSREDKLKKSTAAKNSELVKVSTKSAHDASLIAKKLARKITLYSWSCEYCGDNDYSKSKTPRKYHKECYLKCSGGYRKGSGFGKSGWFKGIWCDSSYELAWVIYNIDHNIQFIRNKEGFEYFKNGTSYKYYPDLKGIINVKYVMNRH